VEEAAQVASSSCCALHNNFIALPDRRRGLIHLWNRTTQSARQLAGKHSSPVSALCFNTREPLLLYSASAEALVEWTVEDGFESLIKEKEDRSRCLQVYFDSPPQHMELDPSSERLVVCAGQAARVVSCSSGRVVARLEGHEASVIAASFLPNRPDVVVTVAEDRRFLAFDIQAGLVLYSSAILCSSSLVSLAVETFGTRFAIGSSDGKVRLFDSADFRQLLVIDVNSMMGLEEKPWRKQAADTATGSEEGEKVISAVPSWKKAFDSMEELCEDAGPMTGVAIECSPISMIFLARRRETVDNSMRAGNEVIRLSAAGGERTSSNEWKEAKRKAPSLIIATSHALIELNLSAMELCSSIFFHSQFDQNEPGNRNALSMSVDFGVVAHAAMESSHLLDPRDLQVVLSGAFTPSIAILHVDLSRGEEEEDGDPLSRQRGREPLPQAAFSGSESFASVFPAGPPSESSFLSSKSESKPSCKAPQTRKRETLEGIKRSSGVTQDQPVTFKNTIKSSGYGGGLAKGVKVPSKPSKEKPSKGPATLIKSYPSDSGPPCRRQPIEASMHSALIRRVEFSPDASRVASCSSDNTIALARTPLKKYSGEASFLTGHTGSVNSIAWSRDSNFLLSASADKSARLWSGKGKGETLLLLNRFSSSSKTSKTSSLEPPQTFCSEVKEARFFYMDRFLVLAVGKQLLFFEWKLHTADEKDDIDRLKKSHKSKLVASFDSSAQNIVSIACVNSFLSHIVLSSGSNRHIEVWDANAGKVIQTYQQAHDRLIHSLVINEASPFVSHPAESYDLFLSTSTDGFVSLWDLRSSSRVAKFTGHTCRVHPVGVAFSPCLRFIATGSEDKLAYLFDLRAGTGSYQQKLEGQTDVVTDVAFNPLFPQLVTSSANGKLVVYNDQ